MNDGYAASAEPEASPQSGGLRTRLVILRLLEGALSTKALLVIALVTLLFPSLIVAQDRLAVQLLREDFAVLRSALVEAHAGLYVYRTQDEITQLFDSVESNLHDMTEQEFFHVIAPALAGIHDGHTKSLPSERWMKWYADSANVLPIRIRLTSGRALVAASADPRIATGSEVLEIDGRSVRDILSQLQAHLPIDGHVPTGIIAALSDQFELWYYLHVEQPRTFDIRLTQPTGGPLTVRAFAIRPKILPALPSEKPITSKSLDTNTALLRVATFAADEFEAAGLDYSALLDSIFANLATSRVSNLIIDIRGNDGGRDTYGSLLLRHLMDKPFAYYQRLLTRTRQISFWSQTQLDSTFNQRFRSGLMALSNGEYRIPTLRHQNLSVQLPQPPLFKGRVWALIDGGTFSTAAEFCAVARSLGRVKCVGEETGGTYEGNSSGTFAILNLPHTGVRVVIPLVRYELAVVAPSERARGVQPDYEFDGLVSIDSEVLVAQVLKLVTDQRLK